MVKLMQRWRRQGSVAPDRYGGWKRSPLETAAEQILALVVERPEELRVRLAASGTAPAARRSGAFSWPMG